MVKRTLAEGQRVINRILSELQEPAGLAHQFAQAILDEAVRNAASRPTPQAPMAAANLFVRGAEIGPSAGGAAEAVAAGAEFGSSIYRQFHQPHNPRGYWLFPATEAPNVLESGDDAIQQVIDSAVRRAF
jgi:hypothetical protein